MLGLLEPALVVGDLGCGTGQVSALVAPHVARVIAVDGSPDMLKAARGAADGVRRTSICASATLEALPIDDGQLDIAIMALVLHHVPDPARALARMRARARSRAAAC